MSTAIYIEFLNEPHPFFRSGPVPTACYHSPLREVQPSERDSSSGRTSLDGDQTQGWCV